MNEISELLKNNQDLLNKILSNQKRIESLLGGGTGSQSPNISDPSEQLFEYYEANKSAKLSWSIGTCFDGEVGAMKISANKPQLWKDVVSPNPFNNRAIIEAFEKLGFEMFDHPGYAVHDRLFIFATEKS